MAWKPEDWQRLGDAVRAELSRRDWTQHDLAAAAGVSLMTVSTLVNGRTRGRLPSSLPKIEAVLGWSMGQSRAILEGWQPAAPSVVRATATVHPTRPPGVREVAELVRRVEGLRAAIEQLPLADADRARFLATLAEYEAELTDVLDRPAIEDAG